MNRKLLNNFKMKLRKTDGHLISEERGDKTLCLLTTRHKEESTRTMRILKRKIEVFFFNITTSNRPKKTPPPNTTVTTKELS